MTQRTNIDKHNATSNKIAFDWVRDLAPDVNWMQKARWAEDGKFFTSSGISAGIDMALGLIERIFDTATANEVALLTEYIWNSDKNCDPFAKK